MKEWCETSVPPSSPPAAVTSNWLERLLPAEAVPLWWMGYGISVSLAYVPAKSKIYVRLTWLTWPWVNRAIVIRAVLGRWGGTALSQRLSAAFCSSTWDEKRMSLHTEKQTWRLSIISGSIHTASDLELQWDYHCSRWSFNSLEKKCILYFFCDYAAIRYYLRYDIIMILVSHYNITAILKILQYPVICCNFLVFFNYKLCFQSTVNIKINCLVCSDW